MTVGENYHTYTILYYLLGVMYIFPNPNTHLAWHLSSGKCLPLSMLSFQAYRLSVGQPGSQEQMLITRSG